jgi:gas vesicle protein
MKKFLALLIGVAAGAALTATIASSKRGKEVRSNLVKKANELRQLLAYDLEKKARMMHDSDVMYS